jgi:hypothetical protein
MDVSNGMKWHIPRSHTGITSLINFPVILSPPVVTCPAAAGAKDWPGPLVNFAELSVEAPGDLVLEDRQT